MTEPATVLHLINTGGPGGAETVCLNLARGLDTRRWRSIVVVPDEGWITRELRSAGVETVVLGHRTRADVARYVQRLATLIRTRGVALVQSHLFGPTVTASALGVLCRVQVVGTLHGEMDVEPAESFRRAKMALVRAGAHRLVFVSDALRSALLRGWPYPASRTTVIANGTHLTSTTPPRPARRLRAELGIADGEFLVGAIGNLRPAKGYDLFLHAAARLVARRPGYRFVIVGHFTGPLAGELMALRDALGLRDVVHIAGFRGDVHDVLGSLDLCAITSRTEGFSLVAVEAMASGVPVVATRCGGPEMILDHGRTGMLVPTESADAIADAIDMLRMSPDVRTAMGDAARADALARFTVTGQVAAYERIYRAALRTRETYA